MFLSDVPWSVSQQVLWALRSKCICRLTTSHHLPVPTCFTPAGFVTWIMAMTSDGVLHILLLSDLTWRRCVPLTPPLPCRALCSSFCKAGSLPPRASGLPVPSAQSLSPTYLLGTSLVPLSPHANFPSWRGLP